MKYPVAILLSATSLLSAASVSQWSEPVHVLHDFKPCVTYRATMQGGFLVVEASLQPGWHTFAIDNEERAAERRAGQPSLGIDQPTRIELSDNLQPSGSWYQTPPKDFSKPQLRWYSFGFENRAVFATKLRDMTKTGATLQIRGQACTEKNCKNIDVTLSVPAPGPAAEAAVDLKELVPVRQAE
jgi:hypothetical protein